jgi:hypothetical protein
MDMKICNFVNCKIWNLRQQKHCDVTSGGDECVRATSEMESYCGVEDRTGNFLSKRFDNRNALIEMDRKRQISGFHSGNYGECRLLGYKTPVHTSHETHYVSTTESSQLMPCKI